MRKLIQLQRPFYESAVMIGAIGAAIGVIVTVLQVTMNLVGFEDGRPTGKVIKDLRAEVRTYKSTDDLRDSITQQSIVELKRLVTDSKSATDNNTAILCFLVKSPLPLCNDVLRLRGLK